MLRAILCTFGAFLTCLNLINAVPVNVMLSLTTVNDQGDLNDKVKLKEDLIKLKNIGVHGVMTDVWWGLVEKSPLQYDWRAYKELVDIVEEVGLTFQAVMVR